MPFSFVSGNEFCSVFHSGLIMQLLKNMQRDGYLYEDVEMMNF